MAVKVQQVLEILEQIAPPELACSWDTWAFWWMPDARSPPL